MPPLSLGRAGSWREGSRGKREPRRRCEGLGWRVLAARAAEAAPGWAGAVTQPGGSAAITLQVVLLASIHMVNSRRGVSIPVNLPVSE